MFVKIFKKYLFQKNVFVLNEQKYKFVLENINQLQVANYLRESCEKLLVSHDHNTCSPPIHNKKYDKPILWQLWLQGIDQVPPIIKNCFKSVDYFLGEQFEIKRLGFNQISDFISLSPHILDKYKKGIITHAHFSDIVRNELLLAYGGLWLDATVFISNTKSVLDFCGNRKVAFQNLGIFSNPKEYGMMIGSWMIWSEKENNKIFRLTKTALDNYWVTHNTLLDYYLYHLIVSNFIKLDNKWVEDMEWHKKEYSANTLDLLFFWFNRQYKYEELLWLFAKTGIHKLNFKDNAVIKEPITTEMVFKDIHLFEDMLWRHHVLENQIINGV
jgi:hypothetical protein